MANYLKSIYEELYSCDGLCVLAKGIGMESLFVKFITTYSTVTTTVESLEEASTNSLSITESRNDVVFCLNSIDEEKWIHDELYANGVQQINFPKVSYELF